MGQTLFPSLFIVENNFGKNPKFLILRDILHLRVWGHARDAQEIGRWANKVKKPQESSR